VAGDVNHVFVFEAANDVRDGVGFANVGQKLVAQPFAFGSAGDKPAISTNSVAAGTTRCGLTMSLS
jgi:hypothetical protein